MLDNNENYVKNKRDYQNDVFNKGIKGDYRFKEVSKNYYFKNNNFI